jgi:signal peptidase I
VRRVPRWPLLLLPLVLLGLALFVFDFPRTGSDEMAPNLRKGDLLLACRLCGGPDRGDVVVFANPDKQGDLSLRRIVGAPGDRVEVRTGKVWVNGIPLVDEPLAPLTLSIDGAPRTFDTVRETVGAHQFRAIRDTAVRSTSNRAPQMLDDEFFVVADRRTLARDSRDYGPVRARDVRSRVMRVLHAGDGDKSREHPVP